MPTDWRIVKTRFAAQAFDGEGARLYGGRWNSVGVRMVYTAGSVSLGVLEVASAIVVSESNYLLNPAHPDFAALVIEPPQPFTFDPRLLS